MMSDTWKTVAAPAGGLFKDKGSRFISYLYPAGDEAEISALLALLRKEHHGARHHCYAWRLGTDTVRSRANDDGEPSSTAGKPILGQLEKHGLTQVLLVVVRYFGGTLLGVSGLINAYREAAADAIRHAVVETRISEETLTLAFPYEALPRVMNILKAENLTQRSLQQYESCRLEMAVRLADIPRVRELLESIPGVAFLSFPQQ